jgi:hypothetical protein
MFKLPNKPGKCASIFELADYVEILICKNTRVSQREVVASLGIEADEESVGCESEEDGNYDLLDDVVLEIENRASRCNNKYHMLLRDMDP